MAGMFYSLQEVTAKLKKTEKEIKGLVKEGKLREFRDGPNLLFKIDEVESLLSDTSVMAPKESPAEPEEGEISLAREAAESGVEGIEVSGDETMATAGEGINVLGETDSEYQLADDTMGETKAATDEVKLEEDMLAETKAASDEGLLEEVEEDVSLDSFGSGSGLLDLSLQADDTSLGGILDEIYTAEGEEGQAAPEASAVEVAAGAEEILSEEPSIPQPSLEAPGIVHMYAEPEPDTLSNALGVMLFLPLLVIIYTAIVSVAGFNNVMPTILEKTQGIIWYIMIGAAVAAGLITGGAFMLSAGGKAERKPKVKKEKKPKVKKEKKAKKEKKPKKEKKAKD